MEDTDGFKDLQSLQKTIARANNARLPLEGDFHVITSVSGTDFLAVTC